ncbi:MAG: hypothetical protein LBB11_01285 [Puniceicoccales bacterium]|jgi:hypothetical protein|nr:hypothetical protein [Puniceicoccales bacterium]
MNKNQITKFYSVNLLLTMALGMEIGSQSLFAGKEESKKIQITATRCAEINNTKSWLSKLEEGRLKSQNDLTFICNPQSSTNQSGSNSTPNDHNQKFKVFQSPSDCGWCGWYALVANLNVINGAVSGDNEVIITFHAIAKFFDEVADAIDKAKNENIELTQWNATQATQLTPEKIEELRSGNVMFDVFEFAPIVAWMCNCQVCIYIEEEGVVRRLCVINPTIQNKTGGDENSIIRNRIIRLLYSGEGEDGHFDMILPSPVQAVTIECPDGDDVTYENLQLHSLLHGGRRQNIDIYDDIQ